MLSQKLEIPRKPSTDQINGISTVNGTSTKRKRSLEEPDTNQDQGLKRGKVSESADDEEIIFLDDSGNGAIVIEDD